MDEPKPTPDDPVSVLATLFGEPDNEPTRGCRKYVLEYQDGEPVFRRIGDDPAIERCEIARVIDQTIDELCGNDIVPQKLATHFPGRPIRRNPS